jgi:hypothetical protein
MELFAEVSVAGIPLLFVVMGLVEYIKKFGVQGQALQGASMGIGLLFGVGYQVSAAGVPADFAGWFAVGVYGLALGLVASGIYDVLKGLKSE